MVVGRSLQEQLKSRGSSVTADTLGALSGSRFIKSRGGHAHTTKWLLQEGKQEYTIPKERGTYLPIP